jgi:chemotaxis protein histidine kinase CheA
MFGLAAVAEACHACETLVLGLNGAALGRELCGRLIGTIELVSRSLRGELGSDEESAAALQQAAEALMGGATAHTHEPAPAHTNDAAAEPAAATADGAAHALPDEAAAPQAAHVEERWIQVSARRVDQLCEQVAQVSADYRALTARLGALDQGGGGGANRRAMLEDFDRCRTQLDAVVSASWALRLQPIEPALGELVRHARELAQQQGKRLRAQILAGGAQVERSVLDELWEPLLHIVRNAVDHGIETPDERRGKNPEARLSLRGEPSGSNVILTISDDGRGIDPESVRATAVRRGLLGRDAAAALGRGELYELLFQHGFSTRTEVSELSGRGVGLDVVRSIVEKLGGVVELKSELGQGTELSMSIPTRLSLDRTLVVDCGGALYGIPSRQVLEVFPYEQGAVEAVPGGEVLRRRDETLPYRSLPRLLTTAASDEVLVMVVAAGPRRWAIGCPALVGEFDLLRQPLDPLLARHPHLGASATLDDGRLVLLLAIAGLLRLEGRAAVAAPAAERRRTRILVVDDSEIIRDLVAHVLRGAGFEVHTAIDGSAALMVMQSMVPDAVVADVEMPIMDGFELLRRIRISWPQLPVIMLTTRASPEDRRHAVSLGANAHLVKSGFQEATLLQTVRRFVDH